jgi:hypothetical protein
MSAVLWAHLHDVPGAPRGDVSLRPRISSPAAYIKRFGCLSLWPEEAGDFVDELVL